MLGVGPPRPTATTSSPPSSTPSRSTTTSTARPARRRGRGMPSASRGPAPADVPARRDATSPSARRLLLAERRRASRPASTCTSARASRSPAGMAGGSADAAAALVACDALWQTGLSRDELLRAGRRARLRRAVRPARRAPRSAPAGASGSRPRWPAATYHWVVALAERGPVDAGASTASSTGSASGRGAARAPGPGRGSCRRCAPATPRRSARRSTNDLQPRRVLAGARARAHPGRSAASTARSARGLRLRPDRGLPRHATTSRPSTSPWRSPRPVPRPRCVAAHGPVPGARIVEP